MIDFKGLILLAGVRAKKKYNILWEKLDKLNITNRELEYMASIPMLASGEINHIESL